MNSRRWKIYLLLVIGLFTISSIGCCTDVPPTAVPASLSDWMALLPGAKKISELSIPGTHDAGALHETWPNTARCQTLTIAEQLSAGVRFLDIRCRHLQNTFKIYHGSASQGITFDDVLAAGFTFLKTHPGECIIMSVKEESTPDGNTRSFEETFDAYANKDAEKWFLKDQFPTLAEARGKIVLFRRFTASGVPKGIDASVWPDNTTFWIGKSLRVQDDYVVKDPAAKWTAIDALYQEAATGSPGVLYVNFASGYEPGLMGIPNIHTVSDYVNPRLTSFFRNASPHLHGITLLDFATPDRCALIIGTNR
jgi:1-phosphatidylinositol phosphodiesterase